MGQQKDAYMIPLGEMKLAFQSLVTERSITMAFLEMNSLPLPDRFHLCPPYFSHFQYFVFLLNGVPQSFIHFIRLD